MPEQEQTTETTPKVVEPTSETVDATAAPATEIIEATADQETSTVSETQTTEQETASDQTTDDAKPTETSEDKPADRLVPDIDAYVLPEGVPVEMAQFAKDADYTQEQLDRTIEQFSTIVNANEQGKMQAQRKAGELHVKAWGKQKDYNLSLVQRALKQNDPEGNLSAMLDETGFGNNPAVLDFFLRVGNSMREGGFLKGSINTPKGTGNTAASAMFGGTHPAKSN